MVRLSKILIVAAAFLALGACNVETAPATPSVKNEQARKAQEAANAISFTDNAEIENIKARVELTSKPGALGFITLLNAAGQPILYEGVRGKVTSGSKRLTKPTVVKSSSIGGNNGGYAYVLDQTPSDEGTWGSSSDYIFYWNTKGEYRQWSGTYLYSDKPYRLRVEPLVVSADVPPSVQQH